MKSSEALRKARRLISAGRPRYVCCALVYIGGTNTKVYQKLKKIFSYPGGGTMSLEAYLADRYPDFNRSFGRLSYSDYFDGMREYRLAWIDWMIEGYEAVGD